MVERDHEKNQREFAVEMASRLVLAAIVLAGWGGAANASSLIFQYTGQIYSVAFFNGGVDMLGLSSGSPVSGSFIFDTKCLDTDASSSRAFYQNCIKRMQFDGVSSTPPTTDYSYFLVDADPANNVVGSYLNSVYGNTSDVYEFMLEGAEGAFTSDSPDWQSLDLADFALGDSLFLFQRAIFAGDPNEYQGGPVAVTQYYARFSDLRIRPVPEPDALVLFGLGLAGVGLSRRRRTTGVYNRIAP